MIDECHHQVNKLRPLGPAALVGEADEAAGSDEEKSEAVGQKLGAARLLVPEADRKVPQISYFEQTQDQILAPRTLSLTQHGIRLSHRSHKILFYGGLLNPHWVQSGRSFTYPRPVNSQMISDRMFRKRERWIGFRSPLYTIAREQEEENILLRRIKEDKAVLSLVLDKMDKEDLRVEEIMSSVASADPGRGRVRPVLLLLSAERHAREIRDQEQSHGPR